MNKLKTLLKNPKTAKYIFAVGIALILLVYFGTDLNKNKTVETSVTVDYAKELESSIEKIVYNITGKESEVLVTLESDGETIYANQFNTTENTTEDGVKTEKTDDKEQSYIIVENADGTEQALVVTKINPTVKGVAIVVNGADDFSIEKISKAVTTVLGISSSKVCVISS